MTYNLPQAKTAAGTFSVSIVSDVAGLTVPAVNTIKSLDDASESLDFLPGLVMPGSMSMTLREYFSDHPEGFWHRVFSGSSCQIILNIDEGEVVSNYFRGSLDKKSTRWTERSLTGIKSMTGKVTFTNSLYTLKDVSTGIALVEAKTHQVVNNNIIYLNVRDLFASIFGVGLNPTFDANDVNIISTDLKYQVTGADRGLADVYIRIGSFGQYEGYFNSSDDRAWEKRFLDSYSLLGMLTRNFLVIPRYYFDVASGRHKLELLSRGRNGLPITITGRVKESEEIPESELKIAGIRVSRMFDAGSSFDTCWNWRGQEGNYLATPPAEAKFDIDYSLDLLLDWDVTSQQQPYMQLYAINSSGNYEAVVSMRYWDYENNDWSVADFYQSYMAWVHARYLWKRFKVLGKAYERTYKGIYATGATTSQKELAIGRSIVINGESYYANGVRKRGSANETTVNWIRE
jgi:hypothetical protein